MLKVLIPETVPSYNKGEAAIYAGILKTLRLVNREFKVYLFSDAPDYDGKWYGGPTQIITRSLIPTFRESPKKKLLHLFKELPFHLLFIICPRMLRKLFFKDILWRIYDEIDLVLLGHDNAYSFAHNLAVLFFRIMGKKVVVYGASIRPVVYEKRFARFLLKFCLNKVDLITFREEDSYQNITRLGITAPPLQVTADKAFLLDPVERKEALKLLSTNGAKFDNRPLIGMTVLFNPWIPLYALLEVKDPQERYKVHSQIMAQLIDHLIEGLGAFVILLPHCVGPGDYNDDRTVARDVAKNVKDQSNVVAIDGDYSVSQLKGIIGCCDLFVGERTHSVISAASQAIPFVSLSYSKDVRTHGIIGSMLGQEKWIMDLDHLNTDNLIDTIEKAWKSKAQTKRELLNIIPKIKEKSLLNGVLLKVLMRTNDKIT